MKRHHAGFCIFLMSLLIAPKVPLAGMFGLPSKSSVPLGLAGLLLWMFISPRYLYTCRLPKALGPAQLVVVFGIYSLMISVYFSGSIIQILYAGHLLFYIFSVYILLTGYLDDTLRLQQTFTAFKIFLWIGVLFAAGVIISIWTGPFYPHQVMWTTRHWGGMSLQQGVGFGDGTNQAGAILTVIASYSLLVRDRKRIYPIIIFIFCVTALACTLSRGAIIGIALGCLGLGFLLSLRYCILRKIPRSFGIVVILLVSVIPLVALGMNYSRTYSSGSFYAIMQGFGIDSSELADSMNLRLQLWQGGVDSWLSSEPAYILFGKGFLGSQSAGKRVWATPHNLYVSILGDFGMFGLFLFALPFLIFLSKTTDRLVRTGGTSFQRAGFVATISLLIQSMTVELLYSPKLMSLVLFIFLLSHYRIESHTPKMG